MNKLKKYIATLLIFTLSVAYIPMHVSANSQRAVENVRVDEVYADKGFHPITGKAMVAPKVRLAWQDPLDWDPGTPSLAPSDPNHAKHEPNRYLIEQRNTATGALDILPFPYSNATRDKDFTVGELNTGTLYEFRVIPEHYHKNLADDDVPVRPALNETLYVMTDLGVELVSTDKVISVKFDDVAASNVVYRITYAQVDYQEGDPRSKFDSSSKKFQIDVTKSQTSTDPDTGLLVYELEDNIEPGKPYAVTVEPIVDLGSKDVVYNGQPNIFSTHTTIYFAAIDEGEYIRFEWKVSDSFKINDGKHDLVKTTIYEFVDGAKEGQVIVEFPGKNGAEVDYYKIAQKKGVTLEYQLVLEYKDYDDKVKSNKILFVPQQTIIKPTKPYIAEPYSKKTHEYLQDYLSDNSLYKGDIGDLLEKYTKVGGGYELSAEKAVQKVLEEKFLLLEDTYEPSNLSNLYSENRTFHIQDADQKIQLAWSSFRYRDFITSSPTYGEEITDYNVYYDIWVSDDMNSLSTADKAVEDLKFLPNIGMENQIKNPVDKVIGFSTLLGEYYDKEESAMKPIVPGQVYYIQIMAKKKYGEEFEFSEPEIASIYYGYDGDSFEPPTMSNPPLEVIDVTTTSTKLQWYEEWYEILSKKDEDATDPNTQLRAWEHSVWVSEDKKVYRDYVNGGKQFKLLSLDDVYKLREYVGTSTFDDNFIYRKIDLGSDPYGVSDVKYKLLRLNYKDVEKELKLIRETTPDYTLDEYVRDLMLKESKKQVTLDWQDISPDRDADNDILLTFEQDSLQPNEVYLFFLKPYRVMKNGDILMNYYPATVVVKTLDKDDELDITPTVPYLEVVSGYSDIEMKVVWDYNNDFTYTIRYSTKEDLNSASELEWAITDDFAPEDIPSYIENYSTVVDDLYPDTIYYFWIQATSKNNGKSSKWSSPVMGKTKDLESPEPPRGVGMGSREKIAEHDIKEPIGKDYITVEWILDAKDQYGKDDPNNGGNNTNKVEKAYSYILEVADNPLFLDALRVEITDDNIGSTQENAKILDKNLVQVNDLIANRVYYIRMKTKVVITIPDLDREMVKESNRYSPTVFLVTTVSGDEYDGTVDPSKDNLPDDDYEISYDKDKKQLEFRFRSDEKGDNNVDQRLITELIDKQRHEYEIDIRKYKKEPIESWVVTIPDTILQAFMEQDVNLIVDTGSFLVDLPPEVFSDIQSDTIYAYGNEPTVQMTIDMLSSYEQKREQPEQVDLPVSHTYDMKINVDNEMTSYNIVYAPEIFDVKLRPSSRYIYTANESDGYVYDPEKGEWSRVGGTLEKDRGLVGFSTAIVGKYGLYLTKDPVTNVNHWSEPYRQEVAKALHITGYEENYNPDQSVGAEDLGRLIYGLVNESKDINLADSLTSNEMRQLERAGIAKGLDSKDDVSRLEAIDMLVKTYEIIEGEPVFVQPGIDSSKEVQLKAYEVGLINEETLSRPSDSLSYGEMFFMLQSFID